MRKRFMIPLLFGLGIGMGAFLPCGAQATTEWNVLETIELNAVPLDVAPSLDGQWLFILTPGEVQTYSVRERRVTEHIPVDKDFDHIASLPFPNGLTISSSTRKTVQVVMLAPVYNVDLSGLPFRGPADAPVTVAVFDDYQ